MTFLGKLKKVCTKCSAASIKVYERNVRRLYNLTNTDEEKKEVPVTGKWLSEQKTRIKN